jgi:hypothetical protein
MEQRHRKGLVEPEVAAGTFEPRNFLVTFLLACSFGPLGLRHFYLGNNLLGWIRTGLFVGGFIWAVAFIFLRQPALAFVGIIASIAAIIWAVVDFFYVYFAVKADAQGRPLANTARDKRWARVLFIAMIVLFMFSVILNVIGASVGETNYPASTPRNTNHRSSGQSY